MDQLKGKFVPQFKLRQPQMTTWLLAKRTKRNSVLVVSMFREGFPDSYCRWRALEVHCNNDQSICQLAVSKGDSSKLPELLFNHLQLSDQEYCGLHRLNFGHFVAREAVLDEEYWTAAWLRAEAHWESVSYMRHIDTYKRKYTEQEFYALKRRCCGQEGNSLKCFCFVAVKKEEKNVRRTVLNSVVGTLDLSIRQFVQGETYPGEVKRISAVLACQEPFDAHKYAYIANVCVSKFARRQAIASHMLYLATDMATSEGMKQVFVHVNADNKPAQDLYKKTGFKDLETVEFELAGYEERLHPDKIVSAASTPLSKDQRLLMSMEL